MSQVYSYLRFSLKRQSKGDSYRRQKALTDTYIATNGYTLNPLTLNDLGISAFRGKNAEVGALGKFVRLIEQGQIPKGSRLVVENLDRLSRNEVWEALIPIQKIIRSGVIIVALPDEEKGIEGFTEYDNKSMTEAKVIQLINDLSRGHRESVLKSKRVSNAWRWKRAIWQGTEQLGKDEFGKDIPPPKRQARPNWLTTEKDGFTWKVIENHKDTVCDIFQWALDGLGSSLIVDKLNEEKRHCFARKGKWHVGYINQILRNRAVTGFFQPCKRDEETGKYLPSGNADPNYYPLIVKKSVFNDVQKILAQRKSDTISKDGKKRSKNIGREGKIINLFKGLMHETIPYGKHDVQHMGKLFVDQRNNREPVVQRVNAKFYRSTSPESFPYYSLEKAVLSVIRELDKVSVAVTDNGKTNELETINERLAEIETTLEDCKARLRKKASPTILDLIDELETETEVLQARKMTLESKLTKVDLKPVQSMAGLVLSGKASTEDKQRLRGQILGLLQRMSIAFLNVSSWKRKVIVDMHLCNDRIRTIEILHHRQSVNNSKQPAEVTWKVLGNRIYQPGKYTTDQNGDKIAKMELGKALQILSGGKS